MRCSTFLYFFEKSLTNSLVVGLKIVEESKTIFPFFILDNFSFISESIVLQSDSSLFFNGYFKREES